MCLGIGKVVMISNTEVNSPGLTCGYRYSKREKSFFPFSVVFQGLNTGPGIMKADQEHVAEWIETILNLVPLQSQNNQLGNCERSEPLSTLRL